MEKRADLVEMTARIVSAYVSANTITAEEIPGLVRTIHNTLRDLGEPVAAAVEASREPAVSVKRSITPDYIICLEDGKNSNPSNGICAPATVCRPRNTAPNGGFRTITPWSLRTTPKPALTSPSAWGSASRVKGHR